MAKMAGLLPKTAGVAQENHGDQSPLRVEIRDSAKILGG
jgi:hypothetical protein